jgi:hypothetical protein
MKKPPKKKKQDDNFEKLYKRNWLICLVSLALIVFFAVFFPMLRG